MATTGALAEILGLPPAVRGSDETLFWPDGCGGARIGWLCRGTPVSIFRTGDHEAMLAAGAMVAADPEAVAVSENG